MRRSPSSFYVGLQSLQTDTKGKVGYSLLRQATHRAEQRLVRWLTKELSLESNEGRALLNDMLEEAPQFENKSKLLDWLKKERKLGGVKMIEVSLLTSTSNEAVEVKQ